MKNVLRSLISLFLLISFISNVNAQLKTKKICFYDDEGLQYNFTNIQMTGPDTYYAVGTTDAYNGNGKAILWLDLSRGIHFGIVEIHVINKKPDGCSSYNDSFILRGTSYVYRYGGETIEYFAAGTWDSFCFGDVLAFGIWNGIGPCKIFGAADIKKGTNRNIPNTDINKMRKDQGSGRVNSKNDDFSMRVIPNPVKNNAQIEYKLTTPGKINITIYDLMHRPVKVLANEYKTPGNYAITWNAVNANGSPVSTGLYRVVITTGSKTYSNTIQVLR